MLVPPARRRGGMTLIEVLIALALIGLLAAVVMPTVAGQLREGQSTALANQLVNLRDAISNYRQNVGAFPIALTQLTTQPANGEFDSCNVILSAAERAAWRGPYINQNIVGNMPVGDATVTTPLTRVTVAGQAGLLRIQATGVDNDVALSLEERFDGNNNLATGTILWVAASNGTLTFQIPVRGC